jgi:hypothetical protein
MSEVAACEYNQGGDGECGEENGPSDGTEAAE